MEGSYNYTKRELKQKELFSDITALKYKVQSMAAIVQNPMDDAPYEVFYEWTQDVNDLINKINMLKLDVLEFYGKQ